MAIRQHITWQGPRKSVSSEKSHSGRRERTYGSHVLVRVGTHIYAWDVGRKHLKAAEEWKQYWGKMLSKRVCVEKRHSSFSQRISKPRYFQQNMASHWAHDPWNTHTPRMFYYSLHLINGTNLWSTFAFLCSKRCQEMLNPHGKLAFLLWCSTRIYLTFTFRILNHMKKMSKFNLSFLAFKFLKLLL